MKILVVCQYYYPEQFRINDICEELARVGHEVTVLTGLPNYPSGIIPNEYKKGRKRKEIYKNVEIIRCFEVPRKKSSIILALNYISYAFSASIKALQIKNNYDVVICYQLSPITMAIPAIIYKYKNKKPLLLYCCDLWPESMKSIIKKEENFIYKFIKKISAFVYGVCDCITVTSKAFIDYIENLNPNTKNKIVYLPQHAEDNYYIDSIMKNISENTNFMFVGNVGKAQDIDCIINASNLIKDKFNFKVHIVGDGSYLNESKKIVKEKSLESNFVFHGRHPIERLGKYYEIADCFLLTLKGDNLTGMTLPAKLQSYMSIGKPIIGAINGEAQEIIKNATCGKCVNASDVEGLANLMIDYIENKTNYIEMGKNGRVYFEENFTLNIVIEKIQNLLSELFKENYNV